MSRHTCGGLTSIAHLLDCLLSQTERNFPACASSGNSYLPVIKACNSYLWFQGVAERAPVVKGIKIWNQPLRLFVRLRVTAQHTNRQTHSPAYLRRDMTETQHLTCNTYPKPQGHVPTSSFTWYQARYSPNKHTAYTFTCSTFTCTHVYLSIFFPVHMFTCSYVCLFMRLPVTTSAQG